MAMWNNCVFDHIYYQMITPWSITEFIYSVNILLSSDSDFNDLDIKWELMFPSVIFSWMLWECAYHLWTHYQAWILQSHSGSFQKSLFTSKIDINCFVAESILQESISRQMSGKFCSHDFASESSVWFVSNSMPILRTQHVKNKSK